MERHNEIVNLKSPCKDALHQAAPCWDLNIVLEPSKCISPLESLMKRAVRGVCASNPLCNNTLRIDGQHNVNSFATSRGVVVAFALDAFCTCQNKRFQFQKYRYR